MRILVLLAMVCLIFFAAAYHYSGREQITEPGADAPALTGQPGGLQKVSENETTKTIVAVKPSTSPPTPHAPPQQPDARDFTSPTDNVAAEKSRWVRANGYVEFEMKEGYAVGFGDVLLGKPIEPTKTGYAPVNDAPNAWPSNIIAYYFREELPNRQAVIQAITYFNQNTPVEFVENSQAEDALVFERAREHCYSYLGRIGGHQPIRLSPKCGLNEILHELMHALGFIHEQSRTDRDDFIAINWSNILPEFHNQFFLAPDALMQPLVGTEFDYRSIMLYRPDAFAIDAKRGTMQSRTRELINPSQSGLSTRDLARVRALFRK